MPPCCESILGLKVEAVQGKLVSLEWTEASGGLWEWWHVPGVPLAFPVEIRVQTRNALKLGSRRKTYIENLKKAKQTEEKEKELQPV